MKAIMCLMVSFICFLAGCMPQLAGGGFPQELRIDLVLLRDTAAEDYADFAALDTAIMSNSLGDFANMPDSVVAIPPGAKVCTLYVCGTTTNNDTLSIVPFGYRMRNGPMEVICDAAGVLGTQDVVLYPDDSAAATNAFWVDTWTITNDYWRTSLGVIDNVTDGANLCASLSFDPLDLKYIGCYVHSANGGVSAGEADAVTVFVGFTKEDD